MIEELTMNEYALIWVSAAIAFLAGRRVYKKRGNQFNEKLKFIEKAKRKGHYTQAVAVEKTVHYGDRRSNNIELRAHSMAVSYEFRIHGETFYKTLMFQSPGKTLIEYPQTLIMYYDPRNPEKTICREELGYTINKSNQIGPALGMGVLVLAVTYYLLGFLFG